MKPVVAIVGPTAVGKSELSMHLAKVFDGEIVGADSRQVYRLMDIGTAKPTPEDRNLVPHHVVDIIYPDESFSLVLYQALAYKAIEDIRKRGKLAILVGGSGQYIRAVIEGWRVPPVTPDPTFRQSLEERASREGKDKLYHELETIDPAAAANIDPRNLRRVIRALEVIRATGKPFSDLRQKVPPPFTTLTIGLTTSRDNLYKRIDGRVDRMISQGFVEEVRMILDKGYSPTIPPLSSMGYKQIGEHLQGQLDLATAIQQAKFETHNFARHQYAWFRPSDPQINWFNIEDSFESQVESLVKEQLIR